MDMGNWDEVVEEALIPNDNLLIVDGLNLAFRWKHKGATNFAGEFVKTINSLAKSYHAGKVVVLADFRGSKWRKHLHPKYKFDRKAKYADQTEEEKAAAEQFFADFDDAIDLARKNFEVVKLEGVEADDTAAYLVEKYEDGEIFNHIWLISTDVDWDTLLGNTVSRFAYTSRKEFHIGNFYEDHQCDTPEQLVSVKALMGDAGDSVYGVEGVGSKRAYTLIRQYGDAMTIADSLPLDGNQKYIQALNESQDKIYLNVELVDLRSFHLEAILFADGNNVNILEEVCERLEQGLV